MRVGFFVTFLIFSASDVAYAGGPSTSSAGIDTLLWPTINFILYLLLIYTLYRRFACPVLRDYRAEVESLAIRAQSENDTLRAELDQLGRDLSNIDEEKESIVADLEREGRNMAADILTLANQKVERLLLDTGTRISTEKSRIESDVRKELLSSALNKVLERISRDYTEDQDRQVIEASLVSEVFHSR